MKAVLFPIFVVAFAWIGPSVANAQAVEGAMCKSVVAVESITPTNTGGPRTARRLKRRAERKWHRAASRKYGCLYGELSAASDINYSCDRNHCFIAARPCPKAGLVCS